MVELGRILGLDVGDVRTGVAVSDPLQIIASPHAVVPMASLDAALAELGKIIAATEPVRIVAGIPLNQEGKEGPQAAKTQVFLDRLRAVTNVPIVTQDERFSTAAAERMLIAADVRRKKRKQVVDKVAATHILQSWLDRQAYERRRDAEAAKEGEEGNE
jgi:putative Holliday junction resolvase